MVAQRARAFHQGINCYVPAMAYACDLVHGQPTAFSLGTPAASGVTAISANAGLANQANNTVIPVNFVLDSPYGRGIRLDFSGVPGTNAVVEVQGTDYLGEPIARRFTGSAAATTTTAGGLLAWFRITALKIITTASNAVNITLGTLGTLGLPYKCNVAWAKEGTPPVMIDPAGIFAKWVRGVLTDPASLTTGDPRGTYAPTTLDGVAETILGLEGDNSVNAAGNGGLHGIRQFFA
jgi:hypothetical protein